MQIKRIILDHVSVSPIAMADQVDRKPGFSLQDPVNNLEGFAFDGAWMQPYIQATIGVRNVS